MSAAPNLPHRASGSAPFDPSLAVFTGQYEALAGGFRAMPFRPALPMNRANLRCLGLSVGIAIALAGCERPPESEIRRLADERAAELARDVYDRAYDICLYRVTGPWSGASIEVMRECERQARIAPGMSASGQDPKGLEAKPASPTGEAGDAQ